MMTTVKIKGVDYRIGKLNAITQFHVTRRIAPVMAAMGITMAMLKPIKDKEPTFDDFAPVLGPVTEMMSRMSDADCNYVIFNCLAVVQRDQGENRFAPICTGQQLMFEDIDMLAMLRITFEVIRENLSGFLEGLGDETPSQSS